MSSFARSSVRRSSTDTVVHAVGQRVHVNRLGGGVARVELMNSEGSAVIGSLADGIEVMIVAWKPRGSSGTRYCVRCTGDGLEGWLAAANLRRTRTVAPSPPAPSPNVTPAPKSPAPQSHNSKPRFGGR
jgi:hypothetical protein